MKKTGFCYGMSLLILLASCGKKTVPVASNTNKPNVLPQSKTDPMVGKHTKTDSLALYTPPKNSNNADSAAAIAPATAAYTKTFTVVDSHGRLLLDPEKTPGDITPDWIALKGMRSFTPAQAQTMASRYNIVPPRVIYVPATLAKTGRKGIYYIYSKKFWYWKKEDGLFYLDTNYYQ